MENGRKQRTDKRNLTDVILVLRKEKRKRELVTILKSRKRKKREIHKRRYKDT